MAKISDTSPLVTIIIIHWGPIANTFECIKSLRMLNYLNYRILLIDNGTGSEVRLHAYAPEVEVISLPSNTGFSPAVNQGIKWALSHRSKYAWLLNNDATITNRRTLDELIGCAEYSYATLISPTIQAGGTTNSITAHEVFFPAIGLTLRDNAWPTKYLQSVFRWKIFLSGAALLVNLPKAPQPLFDDIFFAYYEDLDLCLRIGSKELHVCQKSNIDHKVSASTGGNLTKHYYKARNFIYISRKYGRWGFRLKIAFWLLFVTIESRKYWRNPLAFVNTTLQAYRAGAALPLCTVIAEQNGARKHC